MAGVLKVMVMFPSTGDWIVVMFEAGGGNCARVVEENVKIKIIMRMVGTVEANI
jgi:hypothetical protein